jgi:hypothetical protein
MSPFPPPVSSPNEATDQQKRIFNECHQSLTERQVLAKTWAFRFFWNSWAGGDAIDSCLALHAFWSVIKAMPDMAQP